MDENTISMKIQRFEFYENINDIIDIVGGYLKNIMKIVKFITIFKILHENFKIQDI